MKLQIGGTEAKDGWSNFNVQPGDTVDFVGNVTDLSCFFDHESIECIYASHVLEHLSYMDELPKTLKHIYHMLEPGGRLLVSVPDLDRLCRLFSSPALDPQDQFHVMRIIMGGQTDPYDFHKTGFTADILNSFLRDAGFETVVRMPPFDLFNDCSGLVVFGCEISLNMEAIK